VPGLGILLKDLSHSQLALEALSLGAVLYCELPSLPCGDSPLAVFPSCDAYSHDGALLATSLRTARKALAWGHPRCGFYVTDLEWLGGNLPWADLGPYRRMDVICRCEDHAAEVSRAFNRDVLVVDGPGGLLEWAR